MKKIKYIIRKRALGDVLWIEPVIRQYAQTYDRVIVHTRYNELFENYPFKNVVFKKELSFLEKCFIAIEKKAGISLLTTNLDDAYEQRPHLHFLHAYQLKAQLPVSDQYPTLYLSDKEKTQKLVEGKYVVLHLESFSDKKFRQVYGVDWNRVVSFFREKGLQVVQAGLNKDALSGTVNIKTTLRELISLIYNSHVFVGLDSGPSHIAASLGIPSIIFFGAIDPQIRHFPLLFNGIILKQPCEYDNDKSIFNKEKLTCKLADHTGHPKCCTFSTEMVLEKVEALLNKNATENH